MAEILIIDDDRLVRESLGQVVEKIQWTGMLAKSIEEKVLKTKKE